MIRILPLLLAVSIAVPANAADMSGAFNDGANFGRANNAATQANIKSGAGAANVPHASPNVPESSYFGSGGLSAPANSKINDCASGSLDPNSYDAQACRAVNFSQTNPSVRPQFNLQPTDPIFGNARSILNDPAAIAGNIAGTYSGCTTQTIKSPDIFQTQVCNQYLQVEHNTCAKVLTVNFADNGLNCSYGDFLTPVSRIAYIRPATFVGATCAGDIRFKWFYTYSECDGTNAYQYTSTTVPSADDQRMLVSLGCGGQYYVEGSCPGGNCAYTVGLPDANYVCDEYCDDGCCQYHTSDYPIAVFSFQRAIHNYTITDSWDNQCTTLESRLP